MYVGSSERTQQGALSRVRVADDREDGQVAPLSPLAAGAALPPELFEFAFEPPDPVAGAAPVDFELLLARSPAPDPTGEFRKG